MIPTYHNPDQTFSFPRTNYIHFGIHDQIPLGWPVSGGGRISSGFGARLSPFNQEKSYHYGVDIAGSYGTPIIAVADGTVTFAGWRSGYGWFVIVSHANGYQTAYGHNSKLLVNAGQKVKRGDKIALIGNTGERILEESLAGYDNTYAAHALRRIEEYQRDGKFLEKDKIAWY